MSSKVIFQVEFTNQNFKFEIESYRQISEIKEKISKYLFSTKLDSYIITYNNKNVYSENIKASSLIGEVFKNKSFLKLKLIPKEVFEDCRIKAKEKIQISKKLGILSTLIIILLWIGVILYLVSIFTK